MEGQQPNQQQGGQQPNQQQGGQPNPALQTWYAKSWEVSKRIYEYFNALVKVIGVIGSFISFLIYFFRIMGAVEKLEKTMNAGFKDIDRKLDFVNKEISVMNKEVTVTNKIFEGKLGLIEGGLELVNKEIAIKREPAINSENWNYMNIIVILVILVVLVVLLKR
ncbi:uncharacterized protein OCT59_028270 [Rhizophagus irregularis]|uniref:Uncharacterized protein n=1 Tax=Rhizophagus irregularis (strain DAOM 181602 / DAOM 197198 / MUCL 43194) TaxID=747089 RepID=U9UU49_RHIID|nr:hypothetical protein GLOIN_2v1511325 [Rhizophagus irregularis DAOM 181602=DAOM 197198]POG81182.1 hypothetical protein GLOIN_2v1511325 [Rhizophagus irregularis DAOM 181602=DAOM 197198]UZO08002.1 hypothetical protein OCT59_028270 [Rhizophagus irregularis]|eukprot:XP_025188048.1 hypothetical protein GLOIN_2v1511325 [Rhizophagus irregularis DAOM 181602=DAOM 197198]